MAQCDFIYKLKGKISTEITFKTSLKFNLIIRTFDGRNCGEHFVSPGTIKFTKLRTRLHNLAGGHHVRSDLEENSR